MAIPGGQNQIGEANVKITADLTDLKKGVADANRETQKVGKGGRKGTISDERRSTGGDSEGLSSLATLRRALGIGAFVAGVAGSFFKLGQAIREMATQENGARAALEQRAALLTLTAEQEASGLEKIAKELNLELAAFREGNAIERELYASSAASRGRPEHFVEGLLNQIQEQQAQASTRLARERDRDERLATNEYLKRIEKLLQQNAEEQKRFTEQMVGAMSAQLGQIKEVIEFRVANALRR